MKKRLNSGYVESDWELIEDNWKDNKDNEELNTIYKNYKLKTPKFISDLKKMMYLERPENYISITKTIRNLYISIRKSISLIKELKGATYIPSPTIVKVKKIININSKDNK